MPRQCNIMFVTPSSLTSYCSLLFPHWFVTAHGGWDRDWGGETAAQHRCEAWHGGGADAVWVLRSRQARGHHSTAGICLHQGGVPVILSCQLPPHATWTSWAWRVHEVMLLTVCVVCVALSWEFCFRWCFAPLVWKDHCLTFCFIVAIFVNSDSRKIYFHTFF